jgi:hypothetical protein
MQGCAGGDGFDREVKVTHLLARRFNYDFGAAAAVRPRPFFLVNGE